MGAAKCNGFTWRLATWHLNKDSGVSEDFVDAIAFGSNDVLVLRFLDLNTHSRHFTFLKIEIKLDFVGLKLTSVFEVIIEGQSINTHQGSGERKYDVIIIFKNISVTKIEWNYFRSKLPKID